VVVGKRHKQVTVLGQLVNVLPAHHRTPPHTGKKGKVAS
jgi:hypothetical protein